MSLVGPRPLIPGEAVLVEDDYDARFGLRPGMTGPWQAHGRSEIGFDDMVRLDDTYARNWTMSNDIELIVRHPWRGHQRQGASALVSSTRLNA